MHTWLLSRLAFVETLIPPHEVDDVCKIESLTSSLLQSGWIGPPLIVSGKQALTGTHRIAAAKHAGLRLIPVVELCALDQDAVRDLPPKPSRAEIKSILATLPLHLRRHYDARTSEVRTGIKA